MMKRFYIIMMMIILVVGALMIPIKNDHPVLQTCPAFTNYAPDFVLTPVRSYTGLSFDFPPQWILCAARTQIERHNGEGINIFINPLMVDGDLRPDYDAAIHYMYLPYTPEYSSKPLAAYYEDPAYPPYDLEMAKHLYRYYIADYFSSFHNPDECVANIKNRETESDSPLYAEAIEWGIDLCKGAPQDVYNAAVFYGDPQSPYFNWKTGLHLISPLLSDSREIYSHEFREQIWALDERLSSYQNN